MATYEFAIKKHTLNSGKVVLIPVCRKKSKIKLFPESWQRITMIYGKATVLDLNFDPELTYKDCEEHILAYKEVLSKQVEHHVAATEYTEITI
jgi:hypothetical protein